MIDLATYNLTEKQIMVYNYIKKNEFSTVHMLLNSIGLSHANIRYALRRLHDKTLIKKVHNWEDARIRKYIINGSPDPFVNKVKANNAIKKEESSKDDLIERPWIIHEDTLSIKKREYTMI